MTVTAGLSVLMSAKRAECHSRLLPEGVPVVIIQAQIRFYARALRRIQWFVLHIQLESRSIDWSALGRRNLPLLRKFGL